MEYARIDRKKLRKAILGVAFDYEHSSKIRKLLMEHKEAVLRIFLSCLEPDLPQITYDESKPFDERISFKSKEDKYKCENCKKYSDAGCAEYLKKKDA